MYKNLCIMQLGIMFELAIAAIIPFLQIWLCKFEMIFIVIQCSQLILSDIMLEFTSKVSSCLSTHNQMFLVRMLNSVTSSKEVHV